MQEAGLIAPGVVDTTDIREVQASSLAPFTQAHFFAGIGVWSHALRLAGWPDDEPVWTGSCPCTSFSAAGKQRGFDDPRHLWPVWRDLIAECRPKAVFGEQVASPLGREWLELVSTDLEALGYAVGSAGLPACGVGAPHQRQRIWFGAVLPGFDARRMADTMRQRREGLGLHVRRGRPHQDMLETPGGGETGGAVGDADVPRLEGLSGDDHPLRGRSPTDGPTPKAGFLGYWEGAEWLLCRDGKHRPTQSGLSPLAPRSPRGMGPPRAKTIKAYGNSIVAPLAAAFIESFVEAVAEAL